MAVTLTNVFTKTSRDRWKSTVVGAVVLAALLVFGMAVYRDIDVSFWDELPEAFRSIFGIPDGADVGGLAYGAIYSGYGALTMAAIALASGAVSIAGEEKDGTIGLLLGDPVSRTRVYLEKAAALVAVTAVGFVILWLAAIAAPAMLNVDVGSMNIDALMVMMFVNALFYGFMATAIGAWTGKTSVAIGVTSAVMVVSFIAAGLLPLIESIADLVRVVPWHYFTSADPLANGIDWGHFAVLVGSAVVFAGIGVVGVNRRDLRGQSVGTKLIDRLRENPLTHKAAERLAGTARVSRIWVKTASDHQGLLFVVSLVLFAMSVMIGPMFNMLDDTMKSLSEQFPEDLLALFGGGDLGTPEGFYQVEMFGLMIPIGILAVTIAIGAAAMAGEEKRNTMGLLLSNPVRRSTVVIQNTWAMILYGVIVGGVSFLGVAAGSLVGNLGMDLVNVAAACALATLLGLAFGGLALALGGATGRTGIAIYGAVGVAVLTYIANGFLPLNESTEAWARLSPFHYYLSSDPLNTGMHWGNAAVLTGLFLVTVAAAVVLFDRRDLRTSG
ncbi:MAG: ABC transporter permease subunit [Acidimicrobiia bacterium]